MQRLRVASSSRGHVRDGPGQIWPIWRRRVVVLRCCVRPGSWASCYAVACAGGAGGVAVVVPVACCKVPARVATSSGALGLAGPCSGTGLSWLGLRAASSTMVLDWWRGRCNGGGATLSIPLLETLRPCHGCALGWKGAAFLLCQAAARWFVSRMAGWSWMWGGGPGGGCHSACGRSPWLGCWPAIMAMRAAWWLMIDSRWWWYSRARTCFGVGSCELG